MTRARVALAGVTRQLAGEVTTEPGLPGVGIPEVWVDCVIPPPPALHSCAEVLTPRPQDVTVWR